MANNKSKSATLLDETLGGRVRAKRMQLGMSQESLGNALGLTFQQVQKYEKGTNRITVGRLLQIADALEADAGSFMKGLSESNGDGRPSRYEVFMATREGADIVEAMLDLKPEMQRAVIDMARRLGTLT